MYIKQGCVCVCSSVYELPAVVMSSVLTETDCVNVTQHKNFLSPEHQLYSSWHHWWTQSIKSSKTEQTKQREGSKEQVCWCFVGCSEVLAAVTCVNDESCYVFSPDASEQMWRRKWSRECKLARTHLRTQELKELTNRLTNPDSEVIIEVWHLILSPVWGKRKTHWIAVNGNLRVFFS